MPDTHFEFTEEQIDTFYEKAETDLLREGLKRSYKERFLFLTMLVKVQHSMQKFRLRPSILNTEKV